jgi:hypothetical protein
MKLLQYTVLAVLCVFLCIRGIIPALESVNTDFPNYYTSARLFVEGNDVSRLYDDNWFQVQIGKFGMNQMGKFTPFPPITALVMTPLTFLSPLNALRVWTLLNIVLLLFAIVLVARISGRSWIWSAILFLSSGHALANNFKFGQFYLLLALMIILGYRYWVQGEHVKGGVLLGAGAAFKYFPIIFFVEFITLRQWKIATTGVVTIVILTVASILLLGLGIHEQFVLRVLGQHLGGNIQDPFSPTFQSWNSLLRRLFVYDLARNPNPAYNIPAGFYIGLFSIYISVVTLMVVAFKKSSSFFSEFARDIQFGVLGVTGLFLLPASATYHFLLLALPVALLLRGTKWSTPQKSIAALYVSIGFIPYRWFEHFASMGVLTVFSYPRLILMSGLFAASIAFAFTGPYTNPKPILQPLHVGHDTPH